MKSDDEFIKKVHLRKDAAVIKRKEKHKKIEISLSAAAALILVSVLCITPAINGTKKSASKPGADYYVTTQPGEDKLSGNSQQIDGEAEKNVIPASVDEITIEVLMVDVDKKYRLTDREDIDAFLDMIYAIKDKKLPADYEYEDIFYSLYTISIGNEKIIISNDQYYIRDNKMYTVNKDAFERFKEALSICKEE